MRTTQNTARGIGLMILALFSFSTMDALAKSLIADYPPLLVIWVRFLGQFLLILLILNRRTLQFARSRFPLQHSIRVLFQIGAIGFFFLSLPHIGLAEATAIADVSPVLITLGAAIFLREKLGPRRVAGIIAALIGALIIIRPGMGAFSPWALLPLCSAICFTGNALMTRSIGQRETVWTAMLWGGGLGVTLLSLTLPFTWTPIKFNDLPLFLLIGCLGTLGQLFLIKSYSMTEASVVAPFTYVGLIFATFWGFTLFGEWPDHWTLVGTLVIVTAGLYVWHRETRGKARTSDER